LSNRFYEVTIIRFEHRKDVDSFDPERVVGVPLNHTHLSFSEVLYEDNPDKVIEEIKKSVAKLQEGGFSD
jgi:hypothetical protein